jgi:hypothetical protein
MADTAYFLHLTDAVLWGPGSGANMAQKIQLRRRGIPLHWRKKPRKMLSSRYGRLIICRCFIHLVYLCIIARHKAAVCPALVCEERGDNNMPGRVLADGRELLTRTCTAPG